MNKNVLIKSAIATAIAAATTVTAIADSNLYARFRAGVVCVDAADTECNLENRSSRFGIKSNYKVTDGLTAFGRYEFQVELDEGNLRSGEGRAGDHARRLSYVGIKGGFGEFSVGARWTPMYNYIASPVDPFQLLNGTWQGVGYASSFRQSDTLNYKNKFGPANIHLMVQMDEENAGQDIDEVQIGGSFKAGPVNLGLAFRDDKGDGTPGAVDETTIGVHAGTKFGPLGLGISFLNHDEADLDQFLGLVSYSLGGGKKIDVSIGHDMPGTGPEPLMIGAEYVHKLSKNYRWFAAIENTDHDSAADDTLRVGAGMRVEF